ncbi:hypothetical protein ABW19_dt0210206 [Dactylella cylindrospora]|nr:hypothetical protein ABW19_dt0210206 [Dactylella cylindrospora]
MDDAVAEGSRLGKMAIQADGAGDYKQAYIFYQECLRIYVEALKTETQDDRIEWTHEQILIRYERLAELNAWYKRKGLLEKGWLELEDLRDRLENVAPKISTKLRKFSYATPDVSAQSSSTVNASIVPDTQKSTPTAAPAQPATGYQVSSPDSQQIQQPTTHATPLTPTSNTSSTPTAPYQQQPPQQQPYPPQPGPYNGPQNDQAPANIASPTAHNVQPPIGSFGYHAQSGANGIPPTQQPPQQQQNGTYPPQTPAQQTAGAAPPNAYNTPPATTGAYGPGPYQQNPQYPNQTPNQGPNGPAPPQSTAVTYPPQPQPDHRTYLLTPFLRLSLPVKMYHCYGAAQRYRGGAEGWNIEIKDSTKNPIYYLYGLKQANAPLVEMSLHREDGKKTRCMDIYTPLREGRQSYNVGDMTYKHYLPTPVDIYSQGESIPNGPRRRVFTFNGRRFMWKPDGQGGGNLVNESLYEIDDGPAGFRPTQTNGLLGDGKPLETKLAWYEHTMARKKLGRINVVNGLELSIEEIFLGTMLGHLCTAWEQTRKGI